MPPAARQAHTLKRLAVAVIAAAVLCWLVSVTCVIAFAARDSVPKGGGDTPKADAIVVLGAAQYAGHPSPVLRARLDHAIDLWQRHAAKILVLTGGTGRGDTTSEAVVGSAYAQRHDIPDTAIVLESAGRTTSESMHAVAALLRTRGMRSAILVSDPFHMLRLWLLARRVGLRPYTSPTRTSPIGASATANVGYIFSESLKAPVVLLTERDD